MRKALLALLFALALSPVSAAGWLPLVAGPAGGGYQGVGDVQSGWGAWYGLRAYNAAYATGSNAALQVCDLSSGLTCSTINILTSGYVDRATALASAACAVACVAMQVFDQTGNAHTLSNSSPTHAPVVLFSGCPQGAGTPQMCLECTVTNNLTLATTASITQAQPFTFSAVVERNGNTTVVNSVWDFGTGAVNMGFDTANTAFLDAGTALRTATATDNALHAIQGVFNGAASNIFVDGVSNVVATPGTNSASSSIMKLCDDGNGDPLDGLWLEGGLLGSAPTTTVLGNINTNQHSSTSGWNF